MEIVDDRPHSLSMDHKSKMPPRSISISQSAPWPVVEEMSVRIKRQHWSIAENSEKYGAEIERAWMLTKSEALEEIKWSLTAAISKSLFFEKSNGIVEMNRYCQVGGLSQGCIASLLAPVIKASMARARLDRFVQSPNLVLPSLMSVRSWIAGFLKRWKRNILDLQLETLLQATHVLRPRLDELMMVYHVMEPVIAMASVQDFSLTNRLIKICFKVVEKAAAIESQRGQFTSIPWSLLIASISTSIGEMNRWIIGEEFFDSILSDQRPHNRLYVKVVSDFFIEVVDEEKPIYRIHRDLHPIFDGVALDLARARKSALILRKLVGMYELDHCSLTNFFDELSRSGRSDVAKFCSNPIPSNEVSSPTVMFQTSIHREIRSQCSHISTILVWTVVRKLNLGRLLCEIRKLVTVSGIEKVPYKRELDHLIDLAYLEKYCDQMNDTLMVDGGRTWKNFRFQWQFQAKLETMPDIGDPIRMLHLKCDIPWPLNLIVTQSNLDKYSRMFSLFMELECARTRVTRLRFQDLIPTSHVGRRLSILRFDLVQYLSKIMAAVSFKFLDKFRINRILKTKSIEEMCKNHDVMVEELSKVLLLDDRAAVWTKLMKKFTALSRQIDSDWTDANIREIDLIKSRLAFDSSQRLFNDLLAKEYRTFGL